MSEAQIIVDSKPPRHNPMEGKTPNEGQKAAVDSVLNWLADPEASPFFVLRGPAGTGKTFTVQVLSDRVKRSFIYSAPTNKATKVLRDVFREIGLKPVCKTIYSVLGLKMSPNGEVLELSAAERDEEDKLDFSDYSAVVVDEASMINRELFEKHIVPLAYSGTRFLFMGDQFQLPPVGESSSVVWNLDIPDSQKAELTEVMRNKDKVLTAAVSVRDQINNRFPAFNLRTDFSIEGGVVREAPSQMMERIKAAAENGDFHRPNFAKAIAWRNTTVLELNKVIRSAAMPGATSPWVEGDRMIFTAPAKDLDGEICATTDEEGRVLSADLCPHPVFSDIECYNVAVDIDEGKIVTARVPSAKGDYRLQLRLKELASMARSEKRLWREFWDLKEAFHDVRYAYALTAHRSQGSTYNTVFVNYRDILLNRNRKEAFQALYVAMTRPKQWLYLA